MSYTVCENCDSLIDGEPADTSVRRVGDGWIRLAFCARCVEGDRRRIVF